MLPNLTLTSKRLLQGALLALCATGSLAYAGEAGRIVFASGSVLSGTHPVAVGEAVEEGAELATGRDGYLYMKTVDDGLLVLRPSSRARIVYYHIDKDPAKTRVKLELLSGVARTVSGSGVKLARQNFRFNTPVAAIGVRGTDFTVFTDQETSNVTVLTGAVVVSGFADACQPGGAGPCEHPSSRELSAGQAGQMLQVRRGQAVPKLLSGTGVAPDSVTPPRPDEPVAKGGPVPVSEPSLDPQKTDVLLQGALAVKQTASVTPSTPAPPLVAPGDQTVNVPAATPPASQLVWGRWAAVANSPANIDLVKLSDEGARNVALNSYYAVYRTKGTDWVAPQQGTAGFALAQSEAFVMTDATKAVAAASLQNGYLNVDFGKGTFATGFDLLTGSETFKLQSQGYVGNTGELSGNLQFLRPTNMAVSGTLGPNNNAAYIFSSRLDDKRTANGVTYWTK
jgi:hypothetical protein